MYPTLIIVICALNKSQCETNFTYPHDRSFGHQSSRSAPSSSLSYSSRPGLFKDTTVRGAARNTTPADTVLVLQPLRPSKSTSKSALAPYYPESLHSELDITDIAAPPRPQSGREESVPVDLVTAVRDAESLEGVYAVESRESEVRGADAKGVDGEGFLAGTAF